MSNTPRTDALFIKEDDNYPPPMWIDDWARQLERELNESNKIIRQQQLLDEENLMLKNRIKQLEDWKQSALEVEREWDANAVATMLGAKLGESQRKVIQREVPRLLDRIKQLEETGDAIMNCISSWDAWDKAKEAKLRKKQNK